MEIDLMFDSNLSKQLHDNNKPQRLRVMWCIPLRPF
jgi:hypothetical protein